MLDWSNVALLYHMYGRCGASRPSVTLPRWGLRADRISGLTRLLPHRDAPAHGSGHPSPACGRGDRGEGQPAHPNAITPVCAHTFCPPLNPLVEGTARLPPAGGGRDGGAPPRAVRRRGSGRLPAARADCRCACRVPCVGARIPDMTQNVSGRPGRGSELIPTANLCDNRAVLRVLILISA